MPYLEVPSASIYYETHGSGPLLVLVPAANGDTKLYEEVAPILGEKFTVAIYDRRRFSRSKVAADAPDLQGAERLAADADDLELLVKHLQPGKPALIYGSSSGGIVALEFMRRYSDSVAGMIVHEAPVASLLPPEFAQAMGTQIQGVFGEYIATGSTNGVLEWFCASFQEEDQKVLRDYWNDNDANFRYWIDRELNGYPSLELDTEALAKSKDRMVVGLSKEMEQSYLGPVANILSEKTGTQIVTLPYAHMGYASHPKEFAAAVTKEFEGRWGDSK